MNNPPDTSALPEMIAAYLRVLMEGQPRSVLDIGCGAGRIVCELRELGVYAVGVEVQPSEAARATGMVISADGAHLPFASNSFDWGSFRHVPHHLPHPRATFAEAWRVCKHGLVIAEPYFDPSIPSQQLSARLDTWIKQMERRRGDFHADVLSAEDLISYLPDAAACRVETLVPLRPYPIEKLEKDMQTAIADDVLSAPDKQEREMYRAAAHAGEMTANGTLMLKASKGRQPVSPTCVPHPLHIARYNERDG